MKCPICGKPVCRYDDALFVSMDSDETVYDEDVYEYRCEDEHRFFAPTEKQNEHDAEMARCVKAM